MPKFIYTTLLVFFLSNILIAQSVAIDTDPEIDENVFNDKLSFGFSIGGNQSYLNVEGLPEYSRIKNLTGLELGLTMDYKLCDWMSLSPKTALTFYKSEILFNDPQIYSTYRLLPVGLNTMLHFNFMKPKDDHIPYIFVGPNYKFSIDDVQGSNEFPTNNGLFLELGIGFDKDFVFFHFAPELKYSYGLNNINANPILQSVYMHNISLTFNFKG